MQVDDDFELDSLASHSSRTTARKRLTDKKNLVETVKTIFSDEKSLAEIADRIREISTELMTQTDVFEDIESANKAYGCFKQNNVSCTILFYPLRYSLTHFSLWCNNIDPCRPRIIFSRTVYTCPYKYKYNCYVAFQVKTYMKKVEIAVAGKHTTTSHLAGRGILPVKQRSVINSAVRAAPISEPGCSKFRRI
jgi:hypothetical protein